MFAHWIREEADCRDPRGAGKRRLLRTRDIDTANRQDRRGRCLAHGRKGCDARNGVIVAL
jgi:hypothetical protein